MSENMIYILDFDKLSGTQQAQTPTGFLMGLREGWVEYFETDDRDRILNAQAF